MALTNGTKLGPYEIVAPIGAGGMGEVYRARDTRLDRTVAIKVLPPHLSEKTEARQRLEREARAISALSHPHICALYDIGQQDGTDYLVMEYLEGETLAQRLTKGPLLLEQVLQYATEIADALDKAHRKGVTHRDLKPSNIMLTKTGTKLLDFGLAKLKLETGPPAPLSELPTANDNLSAQGMILGTLQYMAPEQLEGKEVDARTEEPEKRWQAASDLCDELKWIAEAGSQAGVPAPLVSHRKLRERLAWVSAALGSSSLLRIGTLWWPRTPPEAIPLRPESPNCGRRRPWHGWAVITLTTWRPTASASRLF